MRIRRKLVYACAAMIVLVVLSFPVSVHAQPAKGVSWDYKLLGPLNQAQAGSGLTMILMGSGSFRTTGSIGGGGSYSIVDASGSVVGSGTWTATTFDSFTSWGPPGNSPGEGGHLELEALFTGTGVGVISGSAHVVIHCSMWSVTAPPGSGYPWPPDYVEAGSYTDHVTGAVMFNLN